ncbi:MAG: LamG-like jellyroll fold domain-containing protein [Ferruginibacter sp.]
MRYAELGNPSNSLQLIGSLGSGFAYNFNANQWYMISMSYDGSKLSMYVDGDKVLEVAGAMVLEFSRLNLGQNWGGYDTKQYVNGRIAECRVWSRALTASEIKLNLCGADPNSNGLLAYWKMNEGTGTTFHNSASSGAKYDLDWTKVWWDNAGSGTLVAVNKATYVTWTNDVLNKCSQ